MKLSPFRSSFSACRYFYAAKQTPSGSLLEGLPRGRVWRINHQSDTRTTAPSTLSFPPKFVYPLPDHSFLSFFRHYPRSALASIMFSPMLSLPQPWSYDHTPLQFHRVREESMDCLLLSQLVTKVASVCSIDERFLCVGIYS